MFETLKDDIVVVVVDIVVDIAETIVSVTETFSKMVSMLCQNGEPFFCQKLKIVYTLFKFHQHVVMYGETLDFQCQHQQYGAIFAVHLLYTVANADIGSLKFL